MSTFKGACWEVGTKHAWGKGCCCCEGIRSAWETLLQPCFNFFVALPVLELEIACRDIALDFFAASCNVWFWRGISRSLVWYLGLLGWCLELRQGLLSAAWSCSCLWRLILATLRGCWSVTCVCWCVLFSLCLLVWFNLLLVWCSRVALQYFPHCSAKGIEFPSLESF